MFPPPQSGAVFMGCSGPQAPRSPRSNSVLTSPFANSVQVGFAPNSLDKCRVRQPLSQNPRPCDSADSGLHGRWEGAPGQVP